MNKFLRAMELLEQANKLLIESIMEKEISYDEGMQVHEHVEKSINVSVDLYNKKGAVHNGND